jgi:hypothetical protein
LFSKSAPANGFNKTHDSGNRLARSPTAHRAPPRTRQPRGKVAQKQNLKPDSRNLIK